jgi:hypothetical protein
VPPGLRIAFWKLSDERHALEIVRPDGSRERVECETRSYLMHDLLHHAVESQAGLQGGFWGNLAAGRTLAEMNDRTGGPMQAAGDGEIAAIEQVVGALSGVVKGRAPAELVAGMRRFAASLGTTMPAWLTEDLVVAVQERMRRLAGRWRATSYGAPMELDWPG